eukprot:CAMPEP_0194027802 /NCGR_PEP_ID=MMETSP0009_2-20130614/1861_1 /TAXON_ID=210454 /ORGANISM="Grammatophora oceanica, Strain CCMP 410" /LENGTH=160 /DNA_ID=CAMNT_0038666975 /DNA_START=279 /DNA_END=761 /DNA_ORIENTATION=-
MTDNNNKQGKPFEENSPPSLGPSSSQNSHSYSPGGNNRDLSADSVQPLLLLQAPSSSAQAVHQGRNNHVASSDDAEEMLRELDTSAEEDNRGDDDDDDDLFENADDSSSSTDPLETDDEATLCEPFNLSLVIQAFFDSDNDEDNDFPMFIPNDDDDDDQL